MTLYWINVLTNISIFSFIISIISGPALVMVSIMLVNINNEIIDHSKKPIKYNCELKYNENIIKHNEDAKKWFSKLNMVLIVIFTISVLLVIFIPSQATMLEIMGV